MNGCAIRPAHFQPCYWPLTVEYLPFVPHYIGTICFYWSFADFTLFKRFWAKHQLTCNVFLQFHSLYQLIKSNDISLSYSSSEKQPQLTPYPQKTP